jgi:hypothetical protein
MGVFALGSPPGGLQERAGVELVLVPVSIRDTAGLPIAGLAREDFTLYESGAPQRIETFDREPTPVSVVIGVDTSGSMNQYLSFVKAAAIRFVERVPRVFAVSLASFAGETTLRCSFSESRNHLFYELDRLRADGGGTAILDATRDAIAAVARRPGRRALVLFTDGEENAVAPEERLRAEETVVREAPISPREGSGRSPRPSTGSRAPSTLSTPSATSLVRGLPESGARSRWRFAARRCRSRPARATSFPRPIPPSGPELAARFGERLTQQNEEPGQVVGVPECPKADPRVSDVNGRSPGDLVIDAPAEDLRGLRLRRLGPGLEQTCLVHLGVLPVARRGEGVRALGKAGLAR